MKFVSLAQFALILILNSSLALGNSESEITQSFERYKEAISKGDGKTAVNYVDQNTLKYYSNVLRASKTADSTAVETGSLIDKVMIFAIRHMATPKEIQAMDAKGLIVFAIGNGLIAKNSMTHVSMGAITVNGDSASVKMLSRGKPSNLTLQLTKHNGVWEVDVTTLLTPANAAFKTLVTSSGKPENEFLFGLLEMLTGRKVSPTVWTPIGE